MTDDSIREEGGVSDQFGRPSRVGTLGDNIPQDIGLPDTTKEVVEIIGVGDKNRLFQVPTAAFTRRVLFPIASRLLVSQNEAEALVDFEGVRLYFEHAAQSAF